MLVDVHSHLSFAQFEKDLDEVIKRAEQANVKYILCSGVGHSSNVKVLELAKKYNIIHASLGLYPIDLLGGKLPDDVVRELEPINLDEELKFIAKNKKDVMAIGEIGMDFKITNDFRKEQQENFEKILSFAEKINKPVVIHTRNAEKECLDVLETTLLKNVVLHSFTGRMTQVKRAEDLGYYFSIPTVVTRLLHFQEVIKRVSLNQILTETDAPYLSPYKNERNEPAFIVETLKIISKIKNIEQQEAEKIIFSNFQKIFLKK